MQEEENKENTQDQAKTNAKDVSENDEASDQTKEITSHTKIECSVNGRTRYLL